MLGKFIAILITLLLLVNVYKHITPQMMDIEDESMQELWEMWKAQYNKGYQTDREENSRFEIFKTNVNKINRWNSQKHTYTKAVNKFADLTGPEFKEKYSMCHGPGLGKDTMCPSADKTCPTYEETFKPVVNWTITGAVTPVKDQKECGSCWAFSTTGVLEALYFLNHSHLISFSEQQLVDCANECYGCMGCWPYLALEYTQQNGLEPEKLYPYTAEDGKCRYKKALAVHTNTGYECVAQNNINQMKGAVNLLPVSIGVEADQEAWQFYHDGVVTQECGPNLDHAVLLTGYGPVPGYKGDAWFVKNSWGSDWGVNGYIFIGQNKLNDDFGVCGILRCGVIPIN
jgi:C1A family cysteine protease